MSRPIIMKGVILVVSCIALAGISHAQISFEKAFGIKKKYYLKDWMVTLTLRWHPPMMVFDLEQVTRVMTEQTLKAMVSAEFPYFSSRGTWWEGNYVEVFYYFDQCEHRRQFVQTLVEKYLVPNIPNFPDYQIEDQGIEPGFDGVTPQCCWLDDLEDADSGPPATRKR